MTHRITARVHQIHSDEIVWPKIEKIHKLSASCATCVGVQPFVCADARAKCEIKMFPIRKILLFCANAMNECNVIDGEYIEY